MSIKTILPKLGMQCLCIGILFLLMTHLGWAQTTAEGLPWNGPLEELRKSLTGPVARAIGAVALAAAGGMLAFGGELGDFTKRILMIVLALSVLLVSSSVINLFPQND